MKKLKEKELIIDDTNDTELEFSSVKIDGKGWNYLKPDGTLLWQGDKGFDCCFNFKNGFAIVKIDGKGWNYLKPDGTLLWHGEKWFDECNPFFNELAKVNINGRWSTINKKGELIENTDIL